MLIKSSLPKALDALGPSFTPLLAGLKPTLTGNQVVVDLIVDEQAARAVQDSLAQMAESARKAAEAAKSVNNLKQMALAMHSYHDTFGKFPAYASQNTDGKSLLSWRVQILPFVDQRELLRSVPSR